MAPGLELLLDKVAGLEPRQKWGLRIGGILFVIILLVFAFDDTPEKVEQQQTKPNVTGVFQVDSADVTIESLATQVANLQEKLNLSTQQNATNAATISQLNDTLQSLSNSDTNLKNLYELSRKQKLLETKLSQLSESVENIPQTNTSGSTVSQQLRTDALGNLILPDDVVQPDAQEDAYTDAAQSFINPSPSTTEPAASSVDNNRVIDKRINGDPINNTPAKIASDSSYEFLLKAKENGSEAFNDAADNEEEEESMFIKSSSSDNTTIRRTSAGITHITDQSPSAVQSSEQDNYYVPKRLLPGSLIPAVLLTGVDAPTGSKSSENVVSATFRVTGSAISPNGRRTDLTGCYVTTQVKASLANERAYFRPDLITCELGVGQVKTSLKGYITSPADGTAGLRGRLVSRAGDLLFNATLVGAINGLSQVFGGGQNNRSGNIFTGGDPFALPDSDTATKAATTSAISGAAGILEQYFQDQLDAIYSIVEVRPLVPASIHLLEDVTIELLDPVKPQKLVDPVEQLQEELANQNNRNAQRGNR